MRINREWGRRVGGKEHDDKPVEPEKREKGAVTNRPMGRLHERMGDPKGGCGK